MSHRKILRKFIRSIIEPGSTEVNKFFSGFMTDDIPEELLTKQMKKSNETTLTIDGEVFKEFNLAFHSLCNDSKTEHLKDYEIKRKLWYLLCEAYINHEVYKDNSTLNKKITQFVDEVCLPLEQLEALIKIHNFELTVPEIEIWDFKITKFTNAELSRMGLPAGKLMDEFTNQPLMMIQTEGNNYTLAAIRARKKAKFNLEVIRTFFLSSGEFHDEHFLFEFSETVLLKRKNKQELVSRQWFPKRRSYGFQYSNKLQEGLEISNAHFQSIGKFPKKMRTAVKRAIFWLGKATRDEDYDDKIIALCAAMESLLTVQSDKMKGETLAYRLVLLNSFLNKRFLSPFKLLWIYELRSKVIHGSSLNEATKAEYNTLQRLARDTLSSVISIAEEQNLKSIHGLVTFLETSDKVELVWDWFTDYDSHAANSIKAAFEEAVNKYRPKTRLQHIMRRFRDFYASKISKVFLNSSLSFYLPLIY